MRFGAVDPGGEDRVETQPVSTATLAQAVLQVGGGGDLVFTDPAGLDERGVSSPAVPQGGLRGALTTSISTGGSPIERGLCHGPSGDSDGRVLAGDLERSR